MSHGRTGRAFTLLEAIALVLVVALATPPIIYATTAGARAEVDEQSGVRAVWLASSVLETIIADASSDDETLGFAALADPGYVTDLRARLSDVTTPYEDRGLSYDVIVGDPVDLDGAPAEADAPLAMRRISVEATFRASSGEEVVASFSTVVVNR